MSTASISFNSTDLETYGLHCGYPDLGWQQEVNVEQLAKGGHAYNTEWPSKEITVVCDVSAANITALFTALQNINNILKSDSECALSFDILSGLYWMARCTGFVPSKLSPVNAVCLATFLATKPFAYSTTETNSTHNIDANPDTITEAAGGNWEASPVYTLTAGETLSGATIVVNNTTTGESVTWDGSMVNSDELEIDVANEVVKLNGTVSMSGMDKDSVFPRLAPGVNNSITVSGFGTLGSMDIDYRNRYLL